VIAPPLGSLAEENGRREADPNGTFSAELALKLDRRGISTMTNDTTFFRVWAHRSGDSIFGGASSPVIRNGAYLCFDTEGRAQAECDRLNARRGDIHVHYSIMPTHIEASLPQEMKRKPTEAPSFPALATAPCLASDRRLRVRRSA
jgi:hypothetical protein